MATLNIPINDELKKRLKMRAVSSGMSLQDYTAKVITKGLDALDAANTISKRRKGV